MQLGGGGGREGEGALGGGTERCVLLALIVVYIRWRARTVMTVDAMYYDRKILRYFAVYTVCTGRSRWGSV